MSEPIQKFWPMPESSPRKTQTEVLKWMETLPSHIRYVLVEAPVGCHLKDTKILMFDGSLKKIQDIEVHDQLMGIDSTKRIVKELHSGTEMMYKITPIKGDSFVVNENHILSLITTDSGKNEKLMNGLNVINISVKEYLTKSNWFKENTKLYRPSYIEFTDSQQDLPIDPYLLGLLLGDGTIKSGVCITTIDEQIREKIYYYANQLSLNIRIKAKICTEAKSYYFSTNGSVSQSNNFLIEGNPISGCTNPIAYNYNVDANTDDGSCVLPLNPIIPLTTTDILLSYAYGMLFSVIIVIIIKTFAHFIQF